MSTAWRPPASLVPLRHPDASVVFLDRPVAPSLASRTVQEPLKGAPHGGLSAIGSCEPYRARHEPCGLRIAAPPGAGAAAAAERASAF
ncbi:hypothetical protein GCM10008026_04680 [Chelatococcus composti]|jgi:hypothetical protein|nr:hypothetical protein GCM10008026_04680 [Chelatococcus composti]